VHRNLLLAAILVFGIAACARDEGKVQIAPAVKAANLDSSKTVHLDAECSASKRLLGGGYEFLEPPLSLGSPLIVQASFPLNDRTWRVTVTRPRSFDEDRDGIPTVFVQALCASISGAPIDVAVVSSDEVQASAGSSFDTAEASVSCPDETVRTSGGFKVTPASDDAWNIAGLYNSWMWESAPQGDSGWRARLRRIAGSQGPTPPKLRTYALCSDPPIDAAHVTSASAVRRDPSINFGYLDGVAMCGEDEIASGGGYAFGGDPLVPHVIPKSLGHLKDGSWAVSAIHGFQVGGSSGLTVSAVCIAIPQIVDATILSPRGETCSDCTVFIEYPVAVGVDPSDPTMSESITFTGAATDGQGNALTGSALAWTSYAEPGGTGTPLGTGASITTRLPAPVAGESVGYVIELVASDSAGNTGSDTIVVIVTRPP
jgi:hypothetical protein